MITHWLERPTRISDVKTSSLYKYKTKRLFGLALGGVYNAVFVAKSAVRSYRTFSPLPLKMAVYFSAALSLRFPPLGVTQHPVFVKPGLSSRKTSRAIVQPSIKGFVPYHRFKVNKKALMKKLHKGRKFKFIII